MFSEGLMWPILRFYLERSPCFLYTLNNTTFASKWIVFEVEYIVPLPNECHIFQFKQLIWPENCLLKSILLCLCSLFWRLIEFLFVCPCHIDLSACNRKKSLQCNHFSAMFTPYCFWSIMDKIWYKLNFELSFLFYLFFYIWDALHGLFWTIPFFKKDFL